MASPCCFIPEPVNTHSWNASRSKIALSPNSAAIQIYDAKTGQLEHELTEHTQRVNSIDWGRITDRLVTCGSDRNAFVWTLAEGKWKPALVALRVNRAATFCRWSPTEQKFAVATGSKLVSVCYVDDQHNFWISKHIKKPIKSTATSISWHPNDVLIACGSTDRRVRIFSAYIKEVDGAAKKATESAWSSTSGQFSDMIAEFSTPGTGGAWIHDVAFSPSGDCLAWVSHDSCVCVVSGRNPTREVACVRTKRLPFTCCLWLNESRLVVAGFNCAPYLFGFDAASNKLVELGCLDVQAAAVSRNGSNGSAEDGANFKQTMAAFRSMDMRAQSETKDTEIKSVHQNTITSILAHTKVGNDVTVFSTSGLDGQIVYWNWRTIEQSMQRS